MPQNTPYEVMTKELNLRSQREIIEERRKQRASSRKALQEQVNQILLYGRAFGVYAVPKLEDELPFTTSKSIGRIASKKASKAIRAKYRLTRNNS